MRKVGILLVMLALLGTGCGTQPSTSSRSATSTASTEATTAAQHLKTRPLTIDASGGKKVGMSVEIADTWPEQERGLMYRTSMPEDHGMLFVFDRETTLTFWMKNTLIPLSVAFMDSKGRIVDIQNMKPRTETKHISAKPAQYALETNKGFFRRHGIRVGDRVELPGK